MSEQDNNNKGKIDWKSFGAGFLLGAVGIKLLRNLFTSIGTAIQGFYRSIINGVRQEFNDAVLSGSYNFNTAFDEQQKEYNNPVTLKRWLFSYAKKHKYDGPLLAGQLYAFDYDPLHKDKLEFWDTSPVVLSFGTYWSEAGQDIAGRVAGTGNLVEYGINLHYLPIEIRKAFLNDVFNEIKAKYNGVMYSNEPRHINDFTYDYLRQYIDKYHIDFAVRAYIFGRRRNTICIDYQDWPKGCLIQSTAFVDISANMIRTLYNKYVIISKTKQRAKNSIRKLNNRQRTS